MMAFNALEGVPLAVELVLDLVYTLKHHHSWHFNIPKG